MKLPLALLIVLISILAVRGEDQGDWVDPYKLPIEFSVKPFYAGYLPISNKRFYYVFHESESNPSKDPLVVRISSGPGCSSLYSWLYSKGPFIFTPNTTSFAVNQHNWNKKANVLFIEGPTGVGYSNVTDGK
jgi:serine carboxypeptidase-like clade 1